MSLQCSLLGLLYDLMNWESHFLFNCVQGHTITCLYRVYIVLGASVSEYARPLKILAIESKRWLGNVYVTMSHLVVWPCPLWLTTPQQSPLALCKAPQLWPQDESKTSNTKNINKNIWTEPTVDPNHRSWNKGNRGRGSIDMKPKNLRKIISYLNSLAFPSKCTACGVSWQAGQVKRLPTTWQRNACSCLFHSPIVWLKVSWRREKLVYKERLEIGIITYPLIPNLHETR